MTEKELKDFKAWFNHSTWEPSDRVGDVGAAMLNQMPKLFEAVENILNAPAELEAEKERAVKLLDMAKQYENRALFFEKDAETKREIIRRLMARSGTYEAVILVLGVGLLVSVGAYLLK